MISIYPENLIQKILDQLDPLDVLEFIDWHPESFQISKDKVRAYCPIHKETKFRTLILDRKDNHYQCTRLSCPGSEGGDVIQLYALSEKIAYDDAVKQLIDEFDIPIQLAEEPEEIYRMLVEAENRLQLARVDEPNRLALISEASSRLETIFDRDSENLRALRAKILLLELTEDYYNFEDWAIRLSRAEQDAKNFDNAEKLMTDALERAEENLNYRMRLGEILKAQNKTDEALEQFMVLADYAEAAEEYQTAIEAYRQVDQLEDAGIDVTPMIAQLLVLVDNNQEAARELVRQADKARLDGNLDESLKILEEALEIDPQSEEAVLSLIRTQAEKGISREEFMNAFRHVDKLMEAGLWDRVLETLQVMTEIYPDDTNIVEREIVTHEQLGNRQEAREARLHVLEIYRKEEDLDASKMMLDDILLDDPENIGALKQAAELALELDDRETSITRFRQLENIYEKARDYDEAISIYRRMVEIAPDSARISSQFVSLLLKLERKKQAIEVISKTIENLKEEENILGVRQVVEHGLEVAPERPEFLIEYGEALEALGESVKASLQIVKGCRNLIERDRFDDAIEQLESLLKRDPNNANACAALALAYEQTGQEEKATEQKQTLSVLYFKQGDYHECSEVLSDLCESGHARIADLERYVHVTRVLKDQENREKSLMMLAKQHEKEENYIEANNVIEELIQENESHTEALMLHLRLLKMSGETAKWIEESWSLSIDFQMQDNRDGEVQILQDILQEKPHDLQVIERLIQIFANEGNQEGLEETLSKYLQIAKEEKQYPRASEFLQAFSQIHDRISSFKESLVEIYEEADKIEESITEIKTLIQLYEEQNKVDETISKYEQLIELCPYEDRYYNRLAEIYFDLDKPEEGTETLISIARKYAEKNDIAKAEDIFEQIFEKDPENLKAYLGLAEVYESLDGYQFEATQNLREAALLQVRMGNFEDAEKLLNRALKIIPDNPPIQREIVNLYLDVENNNEQKALEELKKLIQIYHRTGQDEKAFSAWNELITMHPEDEKVRRDLVKEYLDKGRDRDAIETLISLGHVYRSQKKYDKALKICKECEKIDSSDVASKSFKAQLYQDQNKPDKALEVWHEIAPTIQNYSNITQSKNPRTAIYSDENGRYASSGLKVMREYNFDQFIVGESNRFATATAKAVAKAPGQTPHNPLFLHSDVGMGKTHILHAITNTLFEKKEKLNVVYTNAEEFTSELIDAIQENRLNDFRQQYKSCDAILLDDIHFLAGKQAAQEEFFHLFNALYQAKKQIVITSDRPPREISHLEKRLKSRFGSGVIIEIGPPQFETREAILRSETKKYPKLTFPDEIIREIAETVTSNIRELKAALQQLVNRHELGEEPLNSETLSSVLSYYQTAP